MQRAGQVAWQCLLAHWPQAQRIAVFCGPGNNGGDGYVLAALARISGRTVQVLHADDGQPRSALAQRACAAYLAAGGALEVFSGAPVQADVIVDALFGIGLRAAPRGGSAGMIAAINAAAVPVLALDVPSGVDADTGHVPGSAVVADITLQFLLAHRGLYTGDALEHVGQRRLDTLARDTGGVPAAAVSWSAARLAGVLPPRRRNTHKGESGHVLCIGGNHGSGGAVMLAAQAALRSGAGLVSVATRGEHVAPLLVRCAETMPHAVEQADALVPLLERADVVAIGPGLGQDAWARALYARALASGKPLVLDADALNLLAGGAPLALPQAVLTPHPGEAGRLLGIPTAQVQADRYAAAQSLAQRYGCAVILKGAGSIAAAPGRTPRVIAAGNPGMAVGGMGDVLTGVVAALRAQRLEAFEAAATAALLHGLAGDAAAAEGERGLLPGDLFAPLRRLANP